MELPGRVAGTERGCETPIMFGRVARAVAGDNVEAYAVLHVYSPEAVAGALAAGMGAAGIGSGGSALGAAVDGAMTWGRREQRRFLRLPRRVLAVVTDDGVVLHEWTLAQGKGDTVATWPSKSYTAESDSGMEEVGVRIVVDGKVAVLSGRRGPQHRAIRATVDAIIRHGRPPEG